jgi:hypothetical protein
MNSHEELHDLLALSAAGLLEAAEERRVREHVRECEECRDVLAEFGDLGRELNGLGVPQPSEDLLLRTQAAVAAEAAGRSHGWRDAFLGAGLGMFGWIWALGVWAVWRYAMGGREALLHVDMTGFAGWCVLSLFTILIAAPTAAAVTVLRRRKEGVL